MEFYDPAIDQVLTANDLTPGIFNIDVNGGIYQYLSPATTAGSGLTWQGEKTDSVGLSPIPAGTDNIGVPVFDMIATLEDDGYYRTLAGEPYAVVEEYFTDRSTGTIHKMGIKTLLGPAVDDALGNQFTAWGNAFQAGIIDLNSEAPNAMDDYYQASTERYTTMDLISNDSDPDGDVLNIDGIVQPKHGRVFDHLDGTVTYVSDYDYTGQDQFSYWATDRHGNYSPALVYINVVNDLIFSNDFAE